jgi:hypothetical protein
VIHPVRIRNSSQSKSDLLALVEFHWTLEQRAQLEFAIFPLNMNHLVCDVLKHYWRNLGVLILLLFTQVHNEVQNSHSVVLHPLLLVHGHLICTQQSLEHLGTCIDL